MVQTSFLTTHNTADVGINLSIEVDKDLQGLEPPIPQIKNTLSLNLIFHKICHKIPAFYQYYVVDIMDRFYYTECNIFVTNI